MAPIHEYLTKIMMIAKQDIITSCDKMYILRYIPIIKDRYKTYEDLLFTEFDKTEKLRLEIIQLEEKNKLLNELFDQELEVRSKIIRKYNKSREEIIKLQKKIIIKKNI
jgi:hypothetical protein